MKRWLKPMLFTAFLTLLYAVRPPTFDTQILGLIPSTKLDNADASLLNKPLEANATKIAFLVRSEDPKALVAGLAHVEDSLWALELFESISGRVDQTMASAQYRDLAPFALNFSPQIQFELGGRSWVQRRWYDPTISASQLATDPLMINAGLIEFLSRQQRGFSVMDGWPVKQRGAEFGSILIADAGTQANHLSWQHAFEEGLSAISRDLDASGVTLLASGAPRYTYAGVQQAKAESSLIGGASIALILILVLYVFRRWHVLVLAILPLCAGAASALWVTSWWFGGIHILTMVFGASLLGVSIDFVFHWLFAQHGRHVKAVQRLLWISALSTAIAFYLQSFSSYAVVAQMGVFSAVGIVVSLLVVLGSFPSLVPHIARVHRIFPRRIERLPTVRTYYAVGLLILLVVVGMMTGAVTPDDNVRKLQSIDQPLQDQQLEIGEWLAVDFSPTYLIVRAEDDAMLLEKLNVLEGVLTRMRNGNQLEAFDHIGRNLKPYRIQNERLNRAAEWFDEGQLWDRLNVEQRFSLSRAELRESVDQLRILTLNEALALDVFSSYRDYVDIESSPATIVTLSGITLLARQELMAMEEVVFVDRVALVSESLQEGRAQAQTWLFVALLVIAFGFVMTDNLSTAIRRMTVIGWGMVGGIGLTTLMGAGIHVFVMLALLLVVGLSVDYSVFADAFPDARQSIVCSGLTTLLAFGLLGFSEVPVLQSIGLTVAGGVGMAMATAFLLRRTE